MASEILINRLYQMIDEIARLGGEQERTSIVPGILVADASPSDLPTGYIKIVNPRDGTYVPCLTVNGLVVSDNDLVNVLFTKGTEPIALSQSAGSPSSSIKVYQLWESDFGAVAWQTDTTGNLTGTGNLIIPDDLIHSGDSDTLLSFTDDDIEFQVGSEVLLKLTESTQDIVKIGDGGDVDINFNDDMFMQGSDGNFSVGSIVDALLDRLAVIGPSAADGSLGIYTQDADGTDLAVLRIYSLGKPSSFTNRSGFFIYHDYLTGSSGLQSEANGTGNTVPIRIFAETGTIDAGLWVTTDNKIGINTKTVPHGGIGRAMLALEGANASADGPHIQATTATDDYPLWQFLGHTHDNVVLGFDLYFDGSFRSADAGSNCYIRKVSDRLDISYASGVAQGSVVTVSPAISIDLTNGNVGVGHTALTVATPLDIDTRSNTAGLRLRGLAETTEIADFYVSSVGSLIIDLTSGADANQYIDFRTESTTQGLVLRESDGTGTAIFANFYVADSTEDYLNVVISANASILGFVVTDSENIGLRTASQFGSGAGVFGVTNAATNPTTNPTGGGVLYSTGGAGTWRGSGGTITTFGPAEPHCPNCGRDAVLQMQNEGEGWHIILCWTCFLREVMGNNLTKPYWIVKAEGVLN